MSKRLAGRCGYLVDEPFKVTLHPDKLGDPLKWKNPKEIFVNSMSDLFHDDVPDKFIAKVFAIMDLARQHTFMILTKRPERAVKLLNDQDFQVHIGWFQSQAEREFKVSVKEIGPFPFKNVWFGTSVENQATADERIPLLLQIPAAVRFLSCEPLLGPINLTKWLQEIGWCIVGGESGPKARPMHPDWVMSLRDQCQVAQVPFFFKQWGEFREIYRYNSWPKYRDLVGVTTKAIGLEKSVLLNADGSDLVNGGPEHKGYPISHLERVRKKQAGRELDGRMWDEFPS
jgi:protein gp37